MVVAVSGSDFRDRYVDMKRRQKAEEDQMNQVEASRVAEEASGDSDGSAIENVAKIAGIAGATAALAMGGNKLRQRMKSGKSPLDGFPGLKDLQKRAANEGVRKVNLNKVSDFDPVTGAREPTVAEYNVINKGASSPTRSQQELTEYLEKPLGKMGTPQQRPADSALESYVEGRRAQQDPVDRLSAELEGDRQAQRVREVKEELGGQVLEELQREGRDAGSFAQGYVRKEKYVDSSPVQTQSTDSMDIDGYQEHREVKRVLQRNEDLDIGAITAKSEPNFGTANPEQVDNSIERVAARVQEAPIRERSGGGFNQETTMDQMEQNVDPQSFAKEFVTKLPSAADNPSVQRDYSKGLYTKYTDIEGEKTFQRGQERRMDAQDESTVLRRGGDVFGPLKNEPPVPEVLSETRAMDNIGQSNIDPAKAPIDTSPSDTSIRGRSRVQNVPEQFTDAGEYVLDQYDPDPASKPRTEFRIAGVKGAQGPISRDVMMKAQSTQGPLAAEQMREMAATRQPPSKELTYDKDPGGVGIYGVERQFASGPLAKQDQYNQKGELVRQAGDYTRAASMNPTTVFPDARGGESNPRQFQVAPDYVRMDDDTLASAKQRASGPMQQKLGSEMDRRKVAKASMQASDRIMEINRTNPPERAKQMVNDYLNQLRGGQ